MILRRFTQHLKEQNWFAVGLEVIVLIVGIFLGMQVTEWNDERKEREAELQQLHRISQELEANSTRMKHKLEIIVSSISGTEEFISWMGPTVEEISVEQVNNQWMKFFAIGMFSVQRGAIEDYLSRGNLNEKDHSRIRDELWRWMSIADDLEKQYELLRIAHARVNDYSEDLIPSLHDIVASGVVNKEIESKFPYDHNKLLTNPYFQGRLGTYLIRLEFVEQELKRTLQKQKQIISMIEGVEHSK